MIDSTNDAGQATDDDTSSPSEPTSDPVGDTESPSTESTNSDVATTPAEGSEQLSWPTDESPVATAPQGDSSPSGAADTGDASSPDPATTPVVTQIPETELSVAAPGDELSLAEPTVEGLAFSSTAEGSEPETTATSEMVDVASMVVSVYLSPFAEPGAPVSPVQPSIVWAVLAWIRREIQYTFFNRTPQVSPQDITLVLGPGEVSEPIPFYGYDADGDHIRYRVPTRGHWGGPSHGTVTVDQMTGTFTYQADAGYTGPDEFTVIASDVANCFHIHGLLSFLSPHFAHKDTAVISLMSFAPNAVPVTVADSYTTNEDGTLTVSAAAGVLANDSDPDAEPLSVAEPGVITTAHGSVNLAADGSFVYTPTPDYAGSDSFTYSATDGMGTSAPATVTITVTAINDVPVAAGDTVTTAEDNAVSGNVLSNDIDVDNALLTTSLASGPTHGTVTLGLDGSFIYRPDDDYYGPDSFTYTASDGWSTSAPATVAITVTPVNDAPVAVGDTFTTTEDDAVSGNLVSNDTDVDNALLTTTLASQPTRGTVTLGLGGSFIYTPTGNYYGIDSFTYTVSDGTVSSAPATVTVTITAVNDTPVAVGDTFTTAEDSALAGHVLGNDTDVDSAILTTTLADGPSHGSVILGPDGSFIYTPDDDFYGSDSFTYTASDGTATSSPATVTITITAVNDAPIAVGDTFSTAEDVALAGNVLGNDTDIDSSSLTTVLASGPTRGTVVLGLDGSFIYTPPDDYRGFDSFTYTVSDGAITSSPVTVTITITAVNDAPIAVGDTFSTDEDAAMAGNVLGNDLDVDSPFLTTNLSSGPSHGSVILGPDGSFIYTPDDDFYGSDSFTYTASDGTATSTPATVTITVAAFNDTPVAAGDGYAVAENGTLVVITDVGVLANDSDVDGDTLTATLVSGPAHGTLTFNTNGSFTYTPDAAFNGVDSFTYRASDGQVTSNLATVSISITAVNDTPVAVGDAYTVAEDGTLNQGTGTGVLANDTDVENSALTATLVSGPANGTLTLNANGSFTYTPTANFNGTDSFTYTATDGQATSTAATVTITVTAVNDAPVAVGDSFTTNEDTQLAGGVLANDSDIDSGSLTASVVTGPSHGTLSFNTDGTFTYSPNANYTGADSFTYRASDGQVTSNLATVSISITAVNDAPVAVGDSFTVDEDTELVGNVLGNDTDVESNSLTATLASGPANGTLVLNANGSFTYTPDVDFNGTDSFTYTVSDGQATSTAATVSISITAVNDAPVAVGDSFTVDEDTELVGNVAGNDTDVENNSLTATLASGPANGTLVLNANGSFTYTPDVGFNGTDSFTYTVSDGTDASAAATVTITITAVNDAPVAVDDAFTVDEDTELVGNVLGNDTDVENNSLTATLASGPAHGTLTLSANGSFTYTPDVDFNGTDSFTYTVSDGTDASDPATVTITITAVNDTPIAVDDSFTVDEDTELVGNVAGNDTDVENSTLATTLDSGPANGTLTLNANGSFTYTPDADFNGTDSFTYTVSDGTDASDPATVTITITAVNDAPVAVGDAYTVAEDGTLTVPVGTGVLGNDTDVENGSLTATLASGPANGTLTLSANGSFTYTPEADFTGTDSFTYTVSDGTDASDPATVTITITAVNDAPAAVNDSFTVAEDTELVGNVLGNDTDVENSTLTATLASGPANGTLTLNANGSFTYTPDTDFNGTDSFTYTVSDGTDASDPATVTITITAVNDAPVAVDDSFTVDEDTELVGNVLGNDTDVENGSLTATLASGPANGTLTLNANGSFTYTPDADFTGTDSFTYTVSDGTDASDPATVTITITAVNDAPVAVGDSFTVAEDTQLTGNVLGNDTDVENNSLTATLAIGPANGTLVLNANGSFTYTPDTDFAGTDSFTYTVSDGTDSSGPATVTITITAVNDAPVAVDDAFTVAEDTQLTGNVLGNDTDVENSSLTASLVAGPASGTLTFNANGSFTYTPDTDFTGTDSFTYTVSDGQATSTAATVSISITAVNDAPVAVGDSLTVDEDTQLTGNVLGNDTDVENSTLTATLDSGPASGTLTFNANGSFTYTPDADFAGTDSFTYTVSDGTDASDPATVTITITAVNDAPVAIGDSFTVAEDTELVGNVLGNDTDVENGSLTATLASGPANGTLTLNANGSFTYTPDADFAGTDSFTYTVSDGTDSSGPATVTITITAVNDAPVAVDDAFTVAEDTQLTGNVLGNDTDVENSSLTASLVAGPASGTLTFNANGSFTYTPDTDFTGTDSFTYTVSDGTDASDPATVTITINAVNDAPVAVDDSFTVAEDTQLTGNVLGNDTDVENSTLTATLDSGPANGTLTFNANGSFTYTPDTDFTGTDSFTYTVSDGADTSTAATVTITVTAVNDAPVAVDDGFTVAEDTQLTGNVLGNDTDVENSTLTATLDSGPASGTLTFNANGSFTYTPDTDFTGTDSFTYTVSDGADTSTAATVTITVTAVNDAPVAVDDGFTVAEDTQLTGNVLGNDTDVENSTLTATLNSGPASGTLTLNANGSFTYTPDADFAGTDSFTYTVSDGTDASDPATVTITITAVNDAPVAVGDSFTVAEDTELTGNVLGNDTDVENSSLTATLDSGPANGTLTFNANGSFTYTPDTNFNGTDSFTYTVSDGTDTSTAATVTITITAVNDAPVAVDDGFTVAEDTELTGNVLGNDTDVENSTLTATLDSGPANGTLVLNANGSFTYTPDADFNGTDSFTYTVSDGTDASDPATVTITVTAVNDAPVAVDDSFTVAEDTQLTGNVLGNDTDVENSTLTATVASGPANGTLTLNANGSFTYTPDADFTGTDSFTYTVSDGTDASDPATVTITINAVNDAPVSVDDAYTVAEDGTLTVPVGTGVLANDTDVENSTLTATLNSGPANGTLTFNANGSFTYTPDADFNGTDSFTYTVSDGTDTSAAATVTITITAVNDAPVAVGDSFTVAEDTELVGNVLGNDTDVENSTLTATLDSGPANGTLVLNANGSFTYTPDADFNGTDSFTYTVSDGTDASDPATVTITINAVNDAPVAVDDSFTVAEDTQLTGNVLGNDTDVENSTLTATLDSGPTNGTLTLNANGSFTYTPDADFTGTDSFTYTVSDGTDASDPATVTITITAVNDAPVAVGDAFTVAEDTELVGNVLGNDTDVENSTLTATLDSGPANGTLVLNANGSFTYTPDADFAGTDSFTYTVSDGTDTSDPATVTITITAVNDAPVAVNDSFTVAEDTELVGNVLGNDTDVENDSLTATLASGPVSGTLTLNANGSFTYTPDADFAGTDTFTYTVSDGTDASDPATVTITITAVNDAPVAVGDSFTVAEDTELVGNVLGNDTDVENSTLTATLDSGPANGTLTFNANGSFTYTPDADFAGTDSFTYTVSDGTDASDPATVTITIAAVNDAPVAVADAYTVTEDGTLTVPVGTGVLGNDTDVENGSLTATLDSGPANGTLTFNANGSFTYTPDTDFNGTDSFTYTVSDGTDASDPATVTITITAVNDVPVAVADAYTVAEDGTLTQTSGTGVLANDTDVENSTLTATLDSGPANGTLTLNANGSFTYTPDADFNGTDSFTYTVSDGTDTSTAATVTITITAVNDAPVAVDDSVTTNEDTQVSGGVLANDSDIDSGSLTAAVVTGPSHGTLSFNTDGTFTYTPNANYTGADSFTYRASDGQVTSNLATVSISITAVNDTPVAVADAYTVAEDGTLNQGAGTGVLANDTDVENSALTATLVSGPANGTLTLNANGSFTYTPTANFNGTDSFTYTATDGQATSTAATVTITITAVNDAPVAVGDSFTTTEDTQLAGGVLANDSDIDSGSLTAAVVTGPSHGTLSFNTDGTFTYSPNANYTGADSFTYRASDGQVTSNLATVTISITAVNDTPVAVADAYTVAEDGTLNQGAGTGVLANDTDVENSALTATLVSGPANGTLTLNANGSFTYTPTVNFNGTDSFTYTATDGQATSTAATVTITITAVNDAPVAVGDSFTTTEDTQLAGGVLANDSDIDSGSLTAAVVTGPSHGTLSFNTDGTFTYTPNANYTGADSFTYRASDGQVTSNLATVSISITAVNDTPVAVADAYTVAEDGTLTRTSGTGVLANDTDVENSALTATLVSGPANGSLTLNANGSFTYTPNANFNGTDSFTYTATDGQATSTAATVTITITAVNDAPVAVGDSVTTNQNTQVSGAVLANDTDIEGTTLTAAVITGPSNGTLSFNTDGTFTYTPNANYTGADSFTYRASDGQVTSNLATVSITVVDNVAPTAVGVQTTNSGTLGRAEQNDTIVYTFSEPIDPGTILAGWDGSATSVVVRIWDGDILLGILGGNDTLQVYDATNTTAIGLGTVSLGGDSYANGLLGGLLGSNIRFGATGTASTMTMSGNTVTIVLGTYSSSNSLLVGQGTETTAGTMVWTPTTGPEDLADNPLTIATATESGGSDREF
ncbi:Ig-like domain-containing protein [Mycolicibacterium arenosum]|uniref:Ig-like domain-containing protein n=1 Tax=Mycolicibacterium arenosum TaxID=2952157 RepID=UPI0020CE05E8|nr:Ig-like domain-containing protein [Mycolicibacterium sp. CAU 1645]